MILIRDIFKLVFKNMIEKKGRVLLTISGIIIGIFTFTFFLFASQGLTNAISEQFSSFGVNVLAVRPVGAQMGPSDLTSLTDKDISKIKQVVRGYKYIAPAIFYNGQFEYGREKSTIMSLAYPDEFWDDLNKDLGLTIEKGRTLRQGDLSVVVIGAKTASEGFKDKEIKIGNSIKIKDKSFRVIGIIKEQGDLLIDNIILMPFDDIKELSGQDTYSMIRLSFYEGINLEGQENAINRKLNPRNGEKKIEITSPKQVMEQLNNIIGVLKLIISFVSSIALIVGGINVLNTMYSNILERINEISVFKAIGATNTDIRNLFLVESSILGFLGSLIGFFLAYFLAEFLSFIITNFASFNVPVYFNFNLFLAIIVITSLFAMLFGTYPAIKAARIEPGDNLREE